VAYGVIAGGCVRSGEVLLWSGNVELRFAEMHNGEVVLLVKTECLFISGPASEPIGEEEMGTGRRGCRIKEEKF
jgi:hypothetical protein